MEIPKNNGSITNRLRDKEGYVALHENLNGSQTDDMTRGERRYFSPGISSPPKSSKFEQNYSALRNSYSNTNLNALENQNRQNEVRRSNVFNAIGRDVLNNATPDIHKYANDDINDRVMEERKHNSNNPYSHRQNIISPPKTLNFDEYLVEYEKKKKNEREK